MTFWLFYGYIVLDSTSISSGLLLHIGFNNLLSLTFIYLILNVHSTVSFIFFIFLYLLNLYFVLCILYTIQQVILNFDNLFIWLYGLVTEQKLESWRNLNFRIKIVISCMIFNFGSFNLQMIKFYCYITCIKVLDIEVKGFEFSILLFSPYWNV